MPSNDSNLISTELHELDYLLRKWEKAVSKENREILVDIIREFKADSEWGPHNRERFYEYIDAKELKASFSNREGDESPLTVISQDDEDKAADSQMTGDSEAQADLTMMEEPEPETGKTDEEWLEVKDTGEDLSELDEAEADMTVMEDTEMEDSQDDSPVTMIRKPGDENVDDSEMTVMDDPEEEEWREVEESDEETAEGNEAEPEMTVMEEPEQESDYTVIKEKAPAQKPGKKKSILPILLVILGLIIISGIILFLVYFCQPRQQKQVTESKEVVTETVMEKDVSSKITELQAVVKANSPFLFVGDEVNLLPGEEAKLKNIINAFSGFKKIDITLTGHAADVQMPAHEMEVSTGRAIQIKKYFESNVKVIQLTISASGKGFAEPVIKNVPVTEQQANRRVEIVINSAE